MLIHGKEEGHFPDRAKRWFSSSILHTDVSGGTAPIDIPTHTVIHGIKVKPSTLWDQPDITVSVNLGGTEILTPYLIGNVTPDAQEYRISLCLAAVSHTGSPTVDFSFGGSIGSATQGEIDVWLQLSRTL